MTRLASRFGAANIIRRDRPLTREELFRVVPSVFSEDKHESRSERYTYIPTISLLDSLQREGFQPFFACQTRVRDPERREHTKHMLRLRREGQITGAGNYSTQLSRWNQFVSDVAGTISCGLSERARLR